MESIEAVHRHQQGRTELGLLKEAVALLRGATISRAQRSKNHRPATIRLEGDGR